MNTEVDAFVQLRFWPMQATAEYVSLLPTDVKQRLVSSSNIGLNYTTDAATLRLLEIFIGGQNLSGNNYVDSFWSVLQELLVEHYSDNPTV